jgi:CheY-like chemotaxis protein
MSKRIMVVEDQEDNRRILRDLLTSADDDCKMILRIRVSNIDSRSGVCAQYRFKNPFVQIRLLRIFARKLLRADFCNKIGTQKTVSLTAGGSAYSYVPCQAQVAPQPVLSTSSLEVVDAMIAQR